MNRVFAYSFRVMQILLIAITPVLFGVSCDNSEGEGEDYEIRKTRSDQKNKDATMAACILLFSGDSVPLPAETRNTMLGLCLLGTEIAFD